jgi:hypothetical protein
MDMLKQASVRLLALRFPVANIVGLFGHRFREALFYYAAMFHMLSRRSLDGVP